MDCRKIKILQALSKVKEYAGKGDISNAKKEMLKVENILDEKERNTLMNTFVDSIMDYNESIDWRKLESSFSFAKILTGGRI